MFTSKLTIFFVVLSITGFYVTAQDCKCDDSNVDGADAAVGSGAAGGVGKVGANGLPGCPGCRGGNGGKGDGAGAGGAGGVGGNGGAGVGTKGKQNLNNCLPKLLFNSNTFISNPQISPTCHLKF